MNRLRSLRACRVPALIACLVLFVVGSNYCLLSAWSGNTRMACMTVPRDAGALPVQRCSHCAPSAKHDGPGSASAGRSCCPAPVVLPSAPSLDKDVAVAAPYAVPFLAVASAPSRWFASAWHGRPRLPDGQPPTRLARARLSARAPPLA